MRFQVSGTGDRPSFPPDPNFLRRVSCRPPPPSLLQRGAGERAVAPLSPFGSRPCCSGAARRCSPALLSPAPTAGPRGPCPPPAPPREPRGRGGLVPGPGPLRRALGGSLLPHTHTSPGPPRRDGRSVSSTAASPPGGRLSSGLGRASPSPQGGPLTAQSCFPPTPGSPLRSGDQPPHTPSSAPSLSPSCGFHPVVISARPPPPPPGRVWGRGMPRVGEGGKKAPFRLRRAGGWSSPGSNLRNVEEGKRRGGGRENVKFWPLPREV